MDSGERKRLDSMNSDLISKLPSNIVDNILILLPLKDAARTTVLSREWRFKWRYIPELVLVGDDFDDRSNKSPSDYWLQIYQILLLHRGPLNRFAVYLNHVAAKEICFIDQLILFLSEKDIHELILVDSFIIDDRHRHRLPSTLFQCLQLTHLCLGYYALRLPSQFIGFSMLIVIELYWIDISANDFKTFISKCRVLRELTLQELVVADKILEIDACNLKVLQIYDFDGTILLKNVPVLSKFTIESRPVVVGSMPNVVSLSRSLPAVEKFRVIQDSLTDFSGGVIPQRLPNMFNHLKVIELSGLSFNIPKQIKCALLLISSSPNLDKLKIKSHVEDVDITSIFGHQEASSLVGGDSFSKLQQVELEKFNGTVPELEFLEIILAKSLVLKKITIRPPENISDKEGVRILKAINQMERTSPKAKVMFLDRCELLSSQ